MSADAAQEAWTRLRNEGRFSTSSEIPSLASGIDADAGPVRYGLGPGGEGRLLLPLASGDRLPVIPDTPTLRIVDRRYTLDGRHCRYLDMTCTLPELDSVFAELCAQIVGRVASGLSAGRAAAGTISEFRLLLVPAPKEVTTEQVLGLIGELLLLRMLLEKSADAVATWRGPLGERHDFRTGKFAIEVKTAGRRGNEQVLISALDQLLEPDEGKLWLARFTIEVTGRGSVSVSSLFSQICAMTSDPHTFRQKLAAIECPDPHAPVWNELACELEEVRFYKVGQGFPRLLPADVPAGVSEVTYSVDLAAAEASRLSLAEAETILERMVA